MENKKAEQKRGRKTRQCKNTLRKFSDSIKHNNIGIIGASKEKEGVKGAENI